MTETTNKSSSSHKRVTVFAHYDKNNVIQDYVIYYLKELKKVSDIILFVSDSNLTNTEIEKIRPYIKHSIVEKHGEYDFGSYKRGYFYAKENHLLDNCEELIFANDSCYAPLFPFEEMFSKMSAKNADFWGPTENDAEVRDYLPKTKHVQSYFLVFKPQVFNHKSFDNFMSGIKKEDCKEKVIAKYEIGLTTLLLDSGFNYDVYCRTSKQQEHAFIYKFKDLIKKDKSPFLKRSIVLYKNIKLVYPLFIKSFLSKYTNYGLTFIKSDKNKNAENFNSIQRFYFACKHIRRNIIIIRLNKHEQRILLFGKTLFDSTTGKSFWGIFKEKQIIDKKVSVKEFDKIKYQDKLLYKKINHKYNSIGTYKYTLSEKIFSIKNKYSNGIMHKIIYILGIKISKKIKLNRKYLFEIQEQYKNLEKNLINKNTINITFMVSLASMFPAKPFLDYLLSKKQSRYKVKILLVPDFRFGIKNAITSQEECYKELFEKYNTEIIIKSPINEKEDNIDIKRFTDILFCALPYDVSHKKYNLENLIRMGILPAIVNYGYFRSSDYDRNLISSATYSLYWKIFVENEQNLLEYKKYQIIGSDNCVLSGYCKMDDYKFYENKYKNSNKKTIMIAPHHSVQGGYNDILMLSNFFKYSGLFLELPKMYPDINFIFRPHPALFFCLEQKKFWNKEKIEKYVDDMRAFPNVRYSDKGNYLNDFAESDAIIQDCGSFLVDYFYTLKPQCYMLKDRIQIKEKFSEFGQNCLENVYQAFAKEDIINFIDEVVICGKDTKKEEREKFAKEEVMVNYPNVSATMEKVFNQIFGE